MNGNGKANLKAAMPHTCAAGDKFSVPLVSHNATGVRIITEQPAEVAVAYSEDKLALRFSDEYFDDYRYTAQMGRWHKWDGRTWVMDESLAVYTDVRGVCRASSLELSNKLNMEGLARQIAASHTVNAVVNMARYDERHRACAGQWDSDPWALNTPAGILDLKTGAISAHRRDAYCTKITSVEPSAVAKYPLWSKFLEEVTGGDRELQNYLQRMAGYFLTGVTREHALFFFWGTGGNGKTTFVNVLTEILGPYATNAPTEMLMASQTERHPTELAGLQGARLVTASETEEGRRWAQAKVNLMTGGDQITARFMRQDFFTYRPQFKLVVFGNHKPNLRGVDEATRRRFNLVPFTVTIPKETRDPELPKKLRAELGDVFRWAIEGCLTWQQMGLNPPTVVVEATEKYFADQDSLGRWIEERCVLDANLFTSTSALFADWKSWAERAEEFVGDQKAFTARLEVRDGLHWQRTTKARGFRGISLRAVAHRQGG